MTRITYGNQSQWLRARMQGIGASEAAEALGLLPSPLAVYNRKLGLEPPGPPTIPQRVGLALESLLKTLYEEETGRPINDTQLLVRSDDHPFMLATLDGVDCEGDIVEFKTITIRRHRELGDTELEQVPDEWTCQVHQQMIVAGRDRATIAVLAGNESFHLYPVRRNPELCRMLIEAEAELWDRIQRRDPPPAMAEDSAQEIMRAYAAQVPDVTCDSGVEELMARIHALGKLEGHVKKAKDAHKARLAEWMRDASIAQSPAGWQAVRKTVNRAAYTVEAGSYETLTIKPPKGIKHVAGLERDSQDHIEGFEGVARKQLLPGNP